MGNENKFILKKNKIYPLNQRETKVLGSGVEVFLGKMGMKLGAYGVEFRRSH